MNSTIFTTSEFYLSAQVFGYIDTTGHPATQLYFQDSCVNGDGTNGAIKGGNARLEFVRGSKFKNLVNAGTYGQLSQCSVEAGGFTFATGPSTDQLPCGFFNCEIKGTFTGPAGSAWFDPPTLERFRANAGVLAGGATVTVLGVSSGTTLQRPTVATTGTPYFDTTLGKPVWRSGAGWVTADGLAA